MRKSDYGEFYAALTAGLRRSPFAVRALPVLNRVLAVVMYGSYVLLLLVQAVAGWRQGELTGLVTCCMPYVLIPGISFCLLSVVRDHLNRPRPYEEWDLDPLIHRDKKGHSMPSRHVFCAAIISMCVLDLSFAPGAVLLLVTFTISVIRVLGGVHYPKDVAAGFMTGVLCGALLLLF